MDHEIRELREQHKEETQRLSLKYERLEREFEQHRQYSEKKIRMLTQVVCTAGGALLVLQVVGMISNAFA